MASGPWGALRSILDFPVFTPRRSARVPAKAGRRTRTVLMLGPSVEALGGVSSVLKVLRDHWDLPGSALRVIPTCADGGKLLKARTALRAVAAMVPMLALRRVDLVHVHFAARASFWRKSIFVLLAKALGTPVVGHAHSGLFPGFYDGCSPAQRAFIRFVLRRMDRLIVLSEEWADYYRPLYGRSEPVIVPNPAVLPGAVAPMAKRGPVLLALGRLGKGKGTYDILEALPAVLDRHPTAEVWLGGDGEIDIVRAMLADNPRGEQVKLLGWVAGAEKDAALAAADVFLLPSYAEGMPMALLEAMAHRKPVVTTPVGGIPKAVTDGVTGVLIQPGDVPALTAAILGLLEDRERAAAMGEAARRVVEERYALESVLAKLASLYDGVLGRQGK